MVPPNADQDTGGAVVKPLDHRLATKTVGRSGRHGVSPAGGGGKPAGLVNRSAVCAPTDGGSRSRHSVGEAERGAENERVPYRYRRGVRGDDKPGRIG